MHTYMGSHCVGDGLLGVKFLFLPQGGGIMDIEDLRDIGITDSNEMQ